MQKQMLKNIKKSIQYRELSYSSKFTVKKTKINKKKKKEKTDHLKWVTEFSILPIFILFRVVSALAPLSRRFDESSCDHLEERIEMNCASILWRKTTLTFNCALNPSWWQTCENNLTDPYTSNSTHPGI